MVACRALQYVAAADRYRRPLLGPIVSVTYSTPGVICPVGVSLRPKYTQEETSSKGKVLVIFTGSAWNVCRR